MVPVLKSAPSPRRSRAAWGSKSCSNWARPRAVKRLLEADGPAQAMPADLQEDLVSDVVVRAEEQPGEDLRKGARLAVNVDGLQALRHRSGRDLADDVAAGPLDECGDQFARILQAHRRVLGQADAAA